MQEGPQTVEAGRNFLARTVMTLEPDAAHDEAEAARHEEQGTISAAESAQRRPTIYVVDDDPDVRVSTAQLIENFGYRAVPVESPDALFEAAEEDPPDLILQDVKMGTLSAAGMMANLRTHPVTAEAPVVLFSAGEELARTARRLGAVDYLQKPFAPRELERVLERNLFGEPTRTSDDAVTEVRTIFHDTWNIMLAIGNYAQILQQDPEVKKKHARTLEGIGNALLRLEAQTDRLRAFTLSLIPPKPEEDEEGRRRRPSRPQSRHTLSRTG